MANAAPAVGSDFGQLGPASVHQHISSPWLDTPWPITQGWGPSPYSMEPSGHGFGHWHAGVDVGCDCGTMIHIPATWPYVATAVQFSNPSGYGNGLLIQVSNWPSRQQGQPHGRVVDIYLGHLSGYLVPNGAVVPAGTAIAKSGTTGNSTGCHLHFEVRVPGGRYGTDIDPASWLLYGAATQAAGAVVTADQNPYNPITQPAQWAEWQVMNDIKAPLKAAGNELLGIAQAGLGSAMMLGGLVMTGAGLRGMSAGQLGSAARGTLTRRPSKPGPLVGSPEPQGEVAEPAEATTPLPQSGGKPIPQAVSPWSTRRAGAAPRSGEEIAAARAAQPRRPVADRVAVQRSRIRPSHQTRFKPSRPASGASRSPR